MGIKDIASDLVAQGMSALDGNADGKVEAKEVADAFVGRVKETADAMREAADNVAAGFDIDGDGKVSIDEVKSNASAVAGMAKGAVGDLVEKISGKQAAEAQEVDAVVEEVADGEAVDAIVEADQE